MPSTSEKQRRFMGAELARKRAGKKTQTDMSEKQLGEFAGSVQKGGSLEDITFHEEAAERETVMNGETPEHGIHAGYGKQKGQKDLETAGAIQWGSDRGWEEDGDEPKGSVMSANRDNGYGLHYGAPVDYFGPDTDYRAEEIDPHQYGKDFEPFPLRDYYKTEDKQWERGFRLREQDEYDNTVTPGTVMDSMPHVEAHGAVNYQGAGPDKDSGKAGECDYRSFKSQREFARSNRDKKEEYAVDVSGHDTKMGEDIR